MAGLCCGRDGIEEIGGGAHGGAGAVGGGNVDESLSDGTVGAAAASCSMTAAFGVCGTARGLLLSSSGC